MELDDCRRLFASVTVARMATVTATGAPHLVPITFALLDGERVLTAVDHKRKATTALRRLQNIAAEPAVSVLADHYEDDWSRLWWVRADGRARVSESVADSSIAALVARYPEYRARPPQGPFILIEVERFVGWTAS